MWQELLITDLTRMSGDTICLAGIDRTLKCIRPELRSGGGIPERHLRIDGNRIIRPGMVVRLNLEPHPAPRPPHIEDHYWLNIENTRYVKTLSEAQWKSALAGTAKATVAGIFETELHLNKNILPGQGSCSLGTLRPKVVNEFLFQRTMWDGVERLDYRLNFVDATDAAFHIKVNDLALQTYALKLSATMTAGEISRHLTERLRRAEVLLRIGLTRPFQGWCWLQVTGLYAFPGYVTL